MASDGSIIIDTKVDNSGAENGLTKLKSIADKGLKTISTAFVAMGIAAVKTSIDTEQSFAKVNSILQLNKDSVNGAKSEWDLYSDSLKQGANDIKMAYSDYADAAYQAISAGVEQTNVNDFLSQSYQLAKGGLTDLTTATDLLTTVQNAYNLKQEDMVRVSDVLIQTQNKGKTTVDELGSSMGKIIPTANGLNISVEQLGAGYALMTSKGIATAETTTYMNSMFNELGKSGTKVDKVIREMSGKSFAELQASGLSVADALDILNQYAEKNNLALSDMFGSAEAAKAAQVLLGDSIDEITGEIVKGERSSKAYNDMLKDMENSTGSCNKAFIEMNDTTKEKLTQAFADLKNKLSDLAERALPLLVEGFTWFVDNGETIVSILASISTGILVFKGLTFISGLVKSFIAWKGALEGVTVAQGLLNLVMNANPFILMASLVAGVVVGLITLWNTNEDFRNAVISAWENIKQVASDVWNGICTFFTETIPNAFNSFIEFVQSNWEGLLLLLINPFAGAFKLIYDNCEGFRTFIDDLVTNILDTFREWGENISNFFSETVPQWIENITTWFNELPYKIGEALGSTLANIINWGVESWNYLTTNVPIWIEGISTYFSELPGKLKKWFDDSLQKAKTWGTQVYEDTKKSVSNTINNINTYFSELPGKIKKWFDDTVKDLKTWGSQMIEKGKKAAKDTGDKIEAEFKALPGKIKQIGKDIVDGIWNGIVGAKDWLIGKVNGFCGGIVDGFKKSLKINSPSKVMRDIVGSGIVEGIADGMIKNEDQVKDATNKISETVKSEIEKVKKELERDTKDLNIKLDNLKYEEQDVLQKLKHEKEDKLSKVKDKNLKTKIQREYEEKEKALKREYDAKEKNIKDQIALRKEQADEEIKELNNIASMSKEQLQEELNARKEFVKDVNDLEKALIDALKEKYKQEYKAQEESIKKQINNLDKWKDESIKRINSVYDAKINAIDEELKALDKAEKEKDRAELDKEELDKIEKLKKSIEFEHDPTNKAQLEKELEKVTKDRDKRLEELALEDKKEALKNQKDELEEKRKNEIDHINSIYESEKEMYETRLDEAKKFYDEKTNEARLQAEVEKLIVDKNQKEIVDLINSYAPQWNNAGKTLGDKLAEGIKPSIDAISSMIDSIWSSINAAQSAAKSIAVPNNSSVSSVVNNSNTRNFNVNVNKGNSGSYSDVEVAMRKMAFSID